MENKKNQKKTFITKSINNLLGGEFDINEELVWGIIIICIIGILVILWTDFGGITTILKNLFTNNENTTVNESAPVRKMGYGAVDITNKTTTGSINEVNLNGK